MNDKEFVDKILAGDQTCWQEFVERYTDWVIYKAWEFERKFCRMPQRLANCSLLLIMRQRRGEVHSYKKDAESCDEGLELYLWFFKQLRRRLKFYCGKSKLSTYIWVILNSKSMQVDILRWKYGRVDDDNEKRLPVCIKEQPETERRIFSWLRRGKDKIFILAKLKINEQAYKDGVHRVKEALIKAGQLDMLQPVEFKNIDDWTEQSRGKRELNAQEKTTTNKLFYNQVSALLNGAFKKLEPDEQKLIRLYYSEGLSGKQIGEFCSRLDLKLTIDGVKLSSKNVYYLLSKITEKLSHSIELKIEGQKLSGKQWHNVLNILGEEGLWRE